MGKIELESLNGDTQPHLFTYFRTHGSEDGDWEGGYNPLSDGWRQVRSKIVPGAKLIGMSSQGVTQYVMDIKVRLHLGNWWVWVLGEWIGYYPRCKQNAPSSTCQYTGFLFSKAGIRHSADELIWFGSVSEPTFSSTSRVGVHGGRWLRA